MFARLAHLLGLAKARRPQPRRNFRPLLDKLEDRSMMATFTVDDSFTTLRPNQFNTIQDAVDASFANGPARDTISVRAGTYRENVFVNTIVTISGAGKNSLVDPVPGGAPSYGFDLQANDIVIRSFRIGDIDGDASANGGDGSVGINTSNQFSGYTIQNNLIERNVFGIYLNTTTVAPKATLVSGNTIQDNNIGFQVLPAAGNGIYSDQGAENVTIRGNSFFRHGNAEVIFVAPLANGTDIIQFRINVIGNTMRNGAGVFFANVDGGSQIVGNNIVRSFANGIELSGNNHGVLIKGNTLNTTGTEGFTGIYLNANTTGTPNTSNTIQSNTVLNAGLSGIRVRDSDNNIVKSNTVTGAQGIFLDIEAWGNGIGIENGQGNRVESNNVRLSARHGIFVDEFSSNNLILSNNSRDNARKVPGASDYADNSAGPPPDGGTAGTSNTYRKNKGRTQNKPGLIG